MLYISDILSWLQIPTGFTQCLFWFFVYDYINLSIFDGCVDFSSLSVCFLLFHSFVKCCYFFLHFVCICRGNYSSAGYNTTTIDDSMVSCPCESIHNTNEIRELWWDSCLWLPSFHCNYNKTSHTHETSHSIVYVNQYCGKVSTTTITTTATTVTATTITATATYKVLYLLLLLLLLLSWHPLVNSCRLSLVETTDTHGVVSTLSDPDLFSLGLIHELLAYYIEHCSYFGESLLVRTRHAASELLHKYQNRHQIQSVSSYQELCPVCMMNISFQPNTPFVSTCTSCQSSIDRCCVSLRLIENGSNSHSHHNNKSSNVLFMCEQCHTFSMVWNDNDIIRDKIISSSSSSSSASIHSHSECFQLFALNCSSVCLFCGLLASSVSQ